MVAKEFRQSKLTLGRTGRRDGRKEHQNARLRVDNVAAQVHGAEQGRPHLGEQQQHGSSQTEAWLFEPSS